MDRTTALILFKDLPLKELKVVPLFIRLMTPNGAIWSLDQRTDNGVIITSLQGVIKSPLKDNTCTSTVY